MLATPKLDAVAVKLDKFATVSEPIAIAVRPGNASVLYVAERAGRIWAVRDGNVDSSPLLDMRGRTSPGGERGLLGIAISPDGAHIYTSYTDTGGTSQLDEYQLDSDGGIDAGSRRRVLSQSQPYANHNGGNIVFGPDGYLYLGLETFSRCSASVSIATALSLVALFATTFFTTTTASGATGSTSFAWNFLIQCWFRNLARFSRLSRFATFAIFVFLSFGFG